MTLAVEAAKIASSTSGESVPVDLSFLDSTPTLTLRPTITPHSMEQALQGAIAQVVQCAQRCVSAAGLADVHTVYLTGGSCSLRTLTHALRHAMPQATLVQGNQFGGVAAGLAWAGAVQRPTEGAH